MNDLTVHELGRPDGPTVALFHGNGDSGLCWPGAARRWGTAYRVVGVDARGHGGSPRFTAEQLAQPGDVFADDAEAVLEELASAGSPVVAVGHSLGAGALTVVLARRPGLLAGAVLIDPPWDTPVVLGPRPEVGAARVEVILGYRSDPARTLSDHARRNPSWAPEEARAWLAAKGPLDLALMATGAGRPTTPWPELVALIRTPTLVVTGDAPECLVGGPTRATLDRIANPAVAVEVVHGADHYVRQSREPEFHAAVDAWLAERF